MKTYSIEFLVKGPGGTMWAPNIENPVDGTDLKSVLLNLAENLPAGGLVSVIGVRVEQVDE